MLNIRWIVIVVVVGLGSIPVRYGNVWLTSIVVACVTVLRLMRMLKV